MKFKSQAAEESSSYSKNLDFSKLPESLVNEFVFTLHCRYNPNNTLQGCSYIKSFRKSAWSDRE